MLCFNFFINFMQYTNIIDIIIQTKNIGINYYFTRNFIIVHTFDFTRNIIF